MTIVDGYGGDGYGGDGYGSGSVGGGKGYGGGSVDGSAVCNVGPVLGLEGSGVRLASACMTARAL